MRLLAPLSAIFLFLLYPVFPAHVSDSPGSLSQGKFLVATRLLNDPRFREKVVFLLQYKDTSGSLGLILNYPTKVTLSDAFPKQKMAKRKSQAVYVGGPVDVKQVFSLIRLRGSAEDRTLPELQKISGDVYLGSGVETVEALVEELKPYEDLRVYIGYAGWAPGQLEFEMKTGHWLVWTADAAMIFSSDPSRVWPEMLRRSSVVEARSNPYSWMIGDDHKVRKMRYLL